jgi:phosphoglycerate kinase
MPLSVFEERHISGVDVTGKTVFFRTDLNVPMADGVIGDTTRIDRTAPGIVDLAQRGAKVIIASHYGRPKGQRVGDMSLRFAVDVLARTVGRDVAFAEDCIGDETAALIERLRDGDILLLENLRFHDGEEKGDKDFAQALARGIDLYVNDAFSAAHRDHASITGLAALVPAYIGPLMAEELSALALALDAPAKPVAAVVGGAKVSSKLTILNNLVERVDSLIIGGGMANTFLYAQGIAIGASLAEPDMAEQARIIMAKAKEADCAIILPADVILAKEFRAGADHRLLRLGAGAVEDDEMIVDVGAETVAQAARALDQAKTLIWNGPMGAFEIKPFDIATVNLARHGATLTEKNGLISVAGGGDTVAALAAAGVKDRFHYVSTAGGAFLEWMEGRELPGIAALMTEQKAG